MALIKKIKSNYKTMEIV